MSESKVIDKIRKLLALSESPNEHEAAQAAAKAAELMMEHGISAETLGEVQPKHLGKETVKFGKPHRAAWKWHVDLGNAVARATECKFLFADCDEGFGGFYGAADNARTAKEMFLFLQSVLIARAIKEYDELKARRQPLGNNFLKWFLHGAVDKVSYRLWEHTRDVKARLRREHGDAAARYELARVEDASAALVEFGPKKIKSVSVGIAGYGNSEATERGRKAGSEVALGTEKSLG